MELCKHSLPGWCIPVGSELEAKEILFGYVCSSCRKGLKHAQLEGRPYSFFADGVSSLDCEEVKLHECSLEDLLRVGCGLEFGFTEDEDEGA